MEFISATKFNRKSGGAQPRDLQFSGPFLEMLFEGSRARLKPCPSYGAGFTIPALNTSLSDKFNATKSTN
jgi:hypothetical protein